MDIKVLVSRLCRKYDTRDPFEIARQRDILVLREPLGQIQGYYARSHRQQVIHIGQDLDERRQRFTCCHELGHAVMHPDLNTPFLRAATLFSVDKLEIQANKFAVELMFDDAEMQETIGWTEEQVAAWMGVPLRYARYRMQSAAPRP